MCPRPLTAACQRSSIDEGWRLTLGIGHALGVVNLLPLDLLQDDGVTDIQGSIATYSYTPPGTTIPTPEPASILLAASVFAALSLRLRK